MQNSNRNTIIAITLCVLILIGWQPLMNLIWPPAPKLLTQSGALTTGSVTGSGLISRGDATYLKHRAAAVAKIVAEKKEKEKEKEIKEKEKGPAAVAGNKEDIELIPLGFEGPSHLRVVLNSQGASVQRVLLTQFDEADRMGLRVTNKDGTGRPLPLIPGVVVPRLPKLRAQENVGRPDLPLDKTNESTILKPDDERRRELTAASYVMYHYDRSDESRPVETLGTRVWKVVAREIGADFETQKVVFETDLGAPHHVRIRKIYTLAKNENHIGMRVEIVPLEGHNAKLPFRYQIQGAHGLPIEGEWYTTTFHVAITGFDDRKGSGPTRAYEDAREVRITAGGERSARTDRKYIRYAATAVQYFASALVVDDQQPDKKQDFLEFVRSTPVGKHDPNFGFLDDVTVRAITEEMKFEDSITHQYLLYQGPVKVRLLKQLSGPQDVPDELVDRYLDTLHLATLTDAPMPNALGRFANAIYWTDLVIAFTNIIHSLLYYLYQIIPNLGICILVVTVIVRGLLFPLSRRQALHAQKMQAKMAKLSPELKELQKKYAGDFRRLMEERNKLYMQHGVNPLSALGGCLPLLIQMPIFMGLYYALQESVFFRLEPFLWSPNLAAPDMLLWWSEGIPIVSTPDDMGSGLYLGPYFNILPIVAIILMLYQQKKMMPQSEDPQVQAQMKMMKWMMILFGLFFYKVAAGLCIYFIASTGWGIIERRLIAKIKKAQEDKAAANPELNSQATRGGKADDIPVEPKGWWGRKKAKWRARWKEILEQAQKQREYRNEPRPGQPDAPPRPSPRPGGGGPPKKKKKKR